MPAVLFLLLLWTASAVAAEVVITSNGWHSGIVLARRDAQAIPEIADFPDAPYIEFGWGDAEYYPARDPGLGAALGAIFTPSPAVMHVAGLPAHPAEVFPAAERIALALPPEAVSALVARIGASFDRAGAGRAAPSAPGLYRFSLFYPATGRFHGFNTCNTWTARMLAGAGLPVVVEGTVKAEELMRQLRALAQGQEAGAGRY